MNDTGTPERRARLVLVAAVVANAMLVGASWDQVIKQLPARHVIGVQAFSAYSQAADLRSGVAWYAALGITAAVLALTAAVLGLRARPRPAGTRRAAFVVIVAGTVGHMLLTAWAAPVNFSQRDHAGDLDALTRVFDQFAQLNLARAVLQAAVLAALAGAALAGARSGGSTPQYEPGRPA
jgi:hypothetical protein